MSPEQIKELRHALSLSVEEFGAAVGVSKATVNNWEQGRNVPRGPAEIALAKLWSEAFSPDAQPAAKLRQALELLAAIDPGKSRAPARQVETLIRDVLAAIG